MEHTLQIIEKSKISLHSNMVKFKLVHYPYPCIAKIVYIPIWLNSNLLCPYTYPALLLVYIPIWLNSNAVQVSFKTIL